MKFIKCICMLLILAFVLPFLIYFLFFDSLILILIFLRYPFDFKEIINSGFARDRLLVSFDVVASYPSGFFEIITFKKSTYDYFDKLVNKLFVTIKGMK